MSPPYDCDNKVGVARVCSLHISSLFDGRRVPFSWKKSMVSYMERVGVPSSRSSQVRVAVQAEVVHWYEMGVKCHLVIPRMRYLPLSWTILVSTSQNRWCQDMLCAGSPR